MPPVVGPGEADEATQRDDRVRQRDERIDDALAAFVAALQSVERVDPRVGAFHDPALPGPASVICSTWRHTHRVGTSTSRNRKRGGWESTDCWLHRPRSESVASATMPRPTASSMISERSHPNVPRNGDVCVRGLVWGLVAVRRRLTWVRTVVSPHGRRLRWRDRRGLRREAVANGRSDPTDEPLCGPFADPEET